MMNLIIIYFIVGITLSMYIIFLPYLAVKEERKSIFEEYGTKKGLYHIVRAGLLILFFWPVLIIGEIIKS